LKSVVLTQSSVVLLCCLHEPLTHLFNISLVTNKIPKFKKSDYVLPLLKGRDPSLPNNYRPSFQPKYWNLWLVNKWKSI